MRSPDPIAARVPPWGSPFGYDCNGKHAGGNRRVSPHQGSSVLGAPRCSLYRQSIAGTELNVSTRAAWLPNRTRARLRRPWDDITIKSHRLFFAVSMIASAAVSVTRDCLALNALLPGARVDLTKDACSLLLR